MSSIGWLVIGTNRYRSMAIRCLETIKANYSGALVNPAFFFTDKPRRCPHPWIEAIQFHTHPSQVYQRYRHFHRHADRLATCDYLFYVDADMGCVAVGDEILGARVVVTHPAFVNTPSVDCPFDRNPACMSAVPRWWMAPIFKIVFRVAKGRIFAHEPLPGSRFVPICVRV